MGLTRRWLFSKIRFLFSFGIRINFPNSTHFSSRQFRRVLLQRWDTWTNLTHQFIQAFAFPYWLSNLRINILGQPPSADVPEKIRKWREEQQARLEAKDSAEETAKEELRIEAEKELKNWYKKHEETIAKTKALNR